MNDFLEIFEKQAERKTIISIKELVQTLGLEDTGIFVEREFPMLGNHKLFDEVYGDLHFDDSFGSRIGEDVTQTKSYIEGAELIELDWAVMQEAIPEFKKIKATPKTHGLRRFIDILRYTCNGANLDDINYFIKPELEATEFLKIQKLRPKIDKRIEVELEAQGKGGLYNKDGWIFSLKSLETLDKVFPFSPMKRLGLAIGVKGLDSEDAVNCEPVKKDYGFDLFEGEIIKIVKAELEEIGKPELYDEDKMHFSERALEKIEDHFMTRDIKPVSGLKV